MSEAGVAGDVLISCRQAMSASCAARVAVRRSRFDLSPLRLQTAMLRMAGVREAGKWPRLGGIGEVAGGGLGRLGEGGVDEVEEGWADAGEVRGGNAGGGSLRIWTGEAKFGRGGRGVQSRAGGRRGVAGPEYAEERPGAGVGDDVATAVDGGGSDEGVEGASEGAEERDEMLRKSVVGEGDGPKDRDSSESWRIEVEESLDAAGDWVWRGGS